MTKLQARQIEEVSEGGNRVGAGAGCALAGARRGSLGKVALGLLDDHARHCMVDVDKSEQPERSNELVDAVGRLQRRR